MGRRLPPSRAARRRCWRRRRWSSRAVYGQVDHPPGLRAAAWRSRASRARCSSPMAVTVMLALAGAFVLSLTFVPAHGGPAADAARCTEHGGRRSRGPKRGLRAAAARVGRAAAGRWCGAAAPLFAGGAARVQPAGARVHPTARREEPEPACLRVPSTSRRPVPRHRKPPGAKAVASLPEVDDGLLQNRHRRDRLRPDAAQRLRHLHHPQAAKRVARARHAPRQQADRATSRRRVGRARATPTSSPSRSRCASTS